MSDLVFVLNFDILFVMDLGINSYLKIFYRSIHLDD